MKLPPLNALRAFEAVSRHGSVSKAADELCVSQGAVSQQLRNLEDFLGRELFDRTANSIALSPDGKAYAGVVQAALANIADATGEFSQQQQQKQLTISTWKSLAARWLMPNLGDFYRRHPDTSVALDENTQLVTFKNDGVDGAIRFGDGDFGDLNSVFLFHPAMHAVASPDYIAQHGNMESIFEPGDHHLIDHHYPSKELRAQHVHWDELVGAECLAAPGRRTTFPDEQQTFNAALLGRGISLNSNYLIEAELAAGKIEIAAPDSVPAKGAVYFVWPADARPNPALDAFRDWLVDALARYRDD
jgi:LysR family glycine cleavage system transcriptional activator